MVVLALCAGALAAAPAEAGHVILVDGHHAVRVNDPDVPSKAAIALPPAEPAAGGASTASVDRAARRGGRAARAWRRARSATRARVDRRAVYRALRRVERSHRIRSSTYRRWRAWYVRALRTYRRLDGARREQLGYLIDSVEALALAGRLTRTRMPGAFVQLERNRRYWRSLPLKLT